MKTVAEKSRERLDKEFDSAIRRSMGFLEQLNDNSRTEEQDVESREWSMWWTGYSRGICEAVKIILKEEIREQKSLQKKFKTHLKNFEKSFREEEDINPVSQRALHLAEVIAINRRCIDGIEKQIKSLTEKLEEY